VADAGLSFVVPGTEADELLPGGARKAVTSSSVCEFVDLVAQRVAVGGADAAIGAMAAGVAEASAPPALLCLREEEVVMLLRRDDAELWTEEEVLASVVCAHGYTRESPQVAWLARVLSTLDARQRAYFAEFITGAPRLPLRGFRGLEPALTVVRKAGSSPDEMLPSCSTCQVYLKLPPYSSEEVLREKLLQAMEEGRGFFALT